MRPGFPGDRKKTGILPVLFYFRPFAEVRSISIGIPDKSLSSKGGAGFSHQHLLNTGVIMGTPFPFLREPSPFRKCKESREGCLTNECL